MPRLLTAETPAALIVRQLERLPRPRRLRSSRTDLRFRGLNPAALRTTSCRQSSHEPEILFSLNPHTKRV